MWQSYLLQDFDGCHTNYCSIIQKGEAPRSVTPTDGCTGQRHFSLSKTLPLKMINIPKSTALALNRWIGKIPDIVQGRLSYVKETRQEVKKY